jgi:hypothetical protein
MVVSECICAIICIHVYYDTIFCQVEAMKGKHEHVTSAMEQSDVRIKHLEEELGESNKKVHSKLPFVCEQSFLYVVIFWNSALLHST